MCSIALAEEQPITLLALGNSCLEQAAQPCQARAIAEQNQRHRISLLTGGTPSKNWQAPSYNNWTLVERELLNPDSSGSGVYLLGLQAPDTSYSWQAGDLVEVMPRHSSWAVEHFLEGLGLSADTQVQLDGLQETLAQALAGRQLPENRGHLVGMHAQALVDALIPLLSGLSSSRSTSVQLL